VPTWYECKSTRNCYWKGGVGYAKVLSCGAPDSHRRACKEYERHSTRPKIMVMGITATVRSEDRSRCARIQARYVAAVSSKKEFAELLGDSIGFVTKYGCVTGNKTEIKKAMANPHKLIFSDSR